MIVKYYNIAADHTIDQKSETFILINKVFREYHPDFVIIEGLEENRGESPKKLIIISIIPVCQDQIVAKGFGPHI